MILFYNVVLICFTPLLRAYLYWRVYIGKEDRTRLHEKLGQPSLKRPDQPIYWLHAASVGEVQAGLSVIDHIGENHQWLVTTGTVTSAALVAKNKNNNIIHQYIPLDHPIWVKRFLSYWRPDVAIWLESELWPNLILKTHKNDIPLALVNARLSDKSFKRWKMIKKTAIHLFSKITLVLAQTKEDQERFKEFSASAVQTGNIKLATPPLPYDEQAFIDLQQNIGQRPTWLYASTHNGEEEITAHVHIKLEEDIPDLLSIIVPRHPERGDDIETLLIALGRTVARRSKGDKITKETDIYLADTLGELGLFYKLAPIAMIGRSLSYDGGGGHNPIEALKLECVVMTGPNIQFQHPLFDPLFQHNIAIQVADKDALCQQLKDYLSDQSKCDTMYKQAATYIDDIDQVMDRTISDLRPLLEKVAS